MKKIKILKFYIFTEDVEFTLFWKFSFFQLRVNNTLNKANLYRVLFRQK